jgi:methyltransferase (TIGR00027 family)
MKPFRMVRPLPNIAVRTQFFDNQVMTALEKGLNQIVICGAGYDDRGIRFRASVVRFFELDRPATQADKAKRLLRMRARTDALRLIPADLRHGDVARLLRDSGHCADQPTLFVCEGLLVYLDRQTVSEFLRGLRSIASPGSALAASLALRREGEDPNQVVAAANARRQSGRMEPWLTILSASEYSMLLSQAGLVISYAYEAGEGPGRLLLVTGRPNASLEE